MKFTYLESATQEQCDRLVEELEKSPEVMRYFVDEVVHEIDRRLRTMTTRNFVAAARDILAASSLSDER